MNKQFFLFRVVEFVLLSLTFYLSSCSSLSVWYDGKQPQDVDYEQLMVPQKNLPLFADLSNYTVGSINTKSTASDSSLVSLESLLDREETVYRTFKQYKFKEIPFKSNKYPSYAVLSKDIPETAEDDISSPINLFLIETTDTTQNTVEYMVVTMVPDKDYVESKGNEKYTFINKGAFSGVILYSNLDGSFRNIYVYGGNFCPIIPADLIKESEKENKYRYGYLSVVKQIETRTGDDGARDGGEIAGSICIADNKSTLKDRDLSIGYWYGDESTDGDSTDQDDIWDYDGGSSGGGGGGGVGGGYSDSNPQEGTTGGSTGNNGGGIGSWTDGKLDGGTVYSLDDKLTHSVLLYAADGGDVSGSGFYADNILVTIEAVPYDSFVFDRWTGDLLGQPDKMFFLIKQNISSTAYFHSLLDSGPVRPCYDATRKMYNPLKEMTLAPTSKYLVNIVGATFGKTRYNGTKYHRGLDLYALEETPIYAMYDGIISKSLKFVDEQPNRDSKQWPEGYDGDTDGGGNRFYLECMIDGDKYCIAYMHLQAGTPMAKNPRTGKAFAPGDKVYAGELIGYTGRTGNAYNVDFYHLHLGVWKEGVGFINPEGFINGTLQWVDVSKKEITERNIVNIKCDEEPRNSDMWL